MSGQHWQSEGSRPFRRGGAVAAGASNRAVFLDLQGTLGGDGLGDVRGFSLYPFAIQAVHLINELGLLAIVVTNQSRIASGILTLADFDRRMGEVRRELAGGGAWLDGVYCCPHSAADACECRKPRPGMLLQAQLDYRLDLTQCYVVGDTGAWDVVLARVIGCAAVLVRTGLGASSLAAYRHLWADLEPDYVAADVLGAARWIAEQEAGAWCAR
jgi:D-glycero-D-manno-heptose 1,7-bisphosphate phosphatase